MQGQRSLTQRTEVIEWVLHLRDDQLEALYKFLEDLEDTAAVEARRAKQGRPFEEFLKEMDELEDVEALSHEAAHCHS